MWCASSASNARLASPRPRVRRGVSLLEAIAALAIVCTTSAGVLAVVGAGTRAAERSRSAHEAEALAAEIHARLTIADVSTLRTLPASLVSGRFEAPFDEYTWRVDLRPDAGLPGLFDVQIDIVWPDGVQRQHSALYRRSTMLGEEGP